MGETFVAQTTLQRYRDLTRSPGIAGRGGAQAVMDWYLYQMLAGNAFQVRAGTVTTPLIGNVAIVDTAAEMCADAPTGTTIVPTALDLSVRLGTGTLHEYAVKSVGAVSTSGTAFVPLPLLLGGSAAASTARVAATAGTVTVAAELATTTRRHWTYSNPVAVGAGHDAPPLKWAPRLPPILRGPACFYVQVSATTTGPSYYASFDFIEAATDDLV